MIEEGPRPIQAPDKGPHQEKFRQLFDSMMDAFASVDMAGRIQDTNSAYQHLLGYSAMELKQLTYKDLTPENWHSFETIIFEKQVLLRGYSDVYEKEYRHKDGTVIPVELRTFLIRTDTGQPAGMWAIVRDITRRKQAEEELACYREQLTKLVESRTAELAAANRRLEWEAAQRKATEHQLRTRRDQLIHASRLNLVGGVLVQPETENQPS